MGQYIGVTMPLGFNPDMDGVHRQEMGWVVRLQQMEGTRHTGWGGVTAFVAVRQG